MSVTHLGAVVEQHPDRSIGELKTETVLVRVIDPLCDEERSDSVDEHWILECPGAPDFGEAGLQRAMHHRTVGFLLLGAQQPAETLTESRQLRQLSEQPVADLWLLLVVLESLELQLADCDAGHVIHALLNNRTSGRVSFTPVDVLGDEAARNYRRAGQAELLRVRELRLFRPDRVSRWHSVATSVGQFRRHVLHRQIGVFLDSLQARAQLRYRLEQPTYQILTASTDQTVVEFLVTIVAYPRVRLLQRGRVEGRLAGEEGVQYAAQSPDVRLVAVGLLVENLRGDVVRCAAYRSEINKFSSLSIISFLPGKKKFDRHFQVENKLDHMFDSLRTLIISPPREG